MLVKQLIQVAKAWEQWREQDGDKYVLEDKVSKYILRCSVPLLTKSKSADVRLTERDVAAILLNLDEMSVSVEYYVHPYSKKAKTGKAAGKTLDLLLPGMVSFPKRAKSADSDYPSLVYSMRSNDTKKLILSKVEKWEEGKSGEKDLLYRNKLGIAQSYYPQYDFNETFEKKVNELIVPHIKELCLTHDILLLSFVAQGRHAAEDPYIVETLFRRLFGEERAGTCEVCGQSTIVVNPYKLKPVKKGFKKESLKAFNGYWRHMTLDTPEYARFQRQEAVQLCAQCRSYLALSGELVNGAFRFGRFRPDDHFTIPILSEELLAGAEGYEEQEHFFELLNEYYRKVKHLGGEDTVDSIQEDLDHILTFLAEEQRINANLQIVFLKENQSQVSLRGQLSHIYGSRLRELAAARDKLEQFVQSFGSRALEKSMRNPYLLWRLATQPRAKNPDLTVYFNWLRYLYTGTSFPSERAVLLNLLQRSSWSPQEAGSFEDLVLQQLAYVRRQWLLVMFQNAVEGGRDMSMQQNPVYEENMKDNKVQLAEYLEKKKAYLQAVLDRTVQDEGEEALEKKALLLLGLMARYGMIVEKKNTSGSRIPPLLRHYRTNQQDRRILMLMLRKLFDYYRTNHTLGVVEAVLAEYVGYLNKKNQLISDEEANWYLAVGMSLYSSVFPYVQEEDKGGPDTDNKENKEEESQW